MRRPRILLPVIFVFQMALPAFSQPARPTLPSRETLIRDLDEVARVASVMLDGDVCERIMTPRAAARLTVVDPKNRWAASDDFDVNQENYIYIKKLLIRLSRLVPYPCDVNLWMPVKDSPGKVQILIRNVNELSQFWTWGALLQDAPPHMRQVLESGKRVCVTEKSEMVSVLAPVSNSLGDIVGLVEVVSRTEIDAHENVQ
ncbi:MAG: hypothetical protein ACE145_02175 [Terriglobia bacterium]